MITSHYLSTQIINLMMRGVYYPKPDIYIGLMTQLPTTPSDVGVEATGGSYKRNRVLSTDINWSMSNSGEILNTHDIITQIATTTHLPIVGVGIYDSVIGGNLLLSGAASPSQTLSAGFVLSFKSGELKISIDNTNLNLLSNVSLYLSKQLINHLFRSSTLGLYSNLFWGVLAEKPSLVHNDGVEVSGAGYGRIGVLSHESNWSQPDINGLTVNLRDFGLPAGAWADIEGFALYNSLVGGSALIMALIDTEVHGNTSQVLPIIRAGDFSFTIN